MFVCVLGIQPFTHTDVDQDRDVCVCVCVCVCCVFQVCKYTLKYTYKRLETSGNVLPCRLWRVVGWVGILLDVVGGVESALRDGCYPALTLAPTCGANLAS
jgi:hypothetical protein